MGNNDKSENTSENNTEKTTEQKLIQKIKDQKNEIEELQVEKAKNADDQKLIEKIKDQKNEIEELKAIKSKNTDDIAPGIRKTKTFGVGYRNAYEDGRAKKAQESHKAKLLNAQVES